MEINSLLDLSTPHVGYEDSRTKQDVCGCCGTYYVVEPGELSQIKEVVLDMYKVLVEAKDWLEQEYPGCDPLVSINSVMLMIEKMK